MKPLVKAVDVMIVLVAAGLALAGYRAEGGGMVLGWLFATLSHYDD